MIRGYGLGTHGLSATIDDSLVELELDEELSMLSQIGAGHDTVALRLSPPPDPGQRVVISGNPSALGWEAPGTFLVEYVADEAEFTPTLPPSWWWDVTYYEPFGDPDLTRAFPTRRMPATSRTARRKRNADPSSKTTVGAMLPRAAPKAGPVRAPGRLSRRCFSASRSSADAPSEGRAREERRGDPPPAEGGPGGDAKIRIRSAALQPPG